MVAWLPQRLKSSFFEFFSSVQVPFGDPPLEKFSKNIDFSLWMRQTVHCPAKMDFFPRFNSLCTIDCTIFSIFVVLWKSRCMMDLPYISMSTWLEDPHIHAPLLTMILYGWWGPGMFLTSVIAFMMVVVFLLAIMNSSQLFASWGVMKLRNFRRGVLQEWNSCNFKENERKESCCIKVWDAKNNSSRIFTRYIWDFWGLLFLQPKKNNFTQYYVEKLISWFF